MKAPRVLLCWGGRPGYVPPPALSPNQVTVYSHHDRVNPGMIDPPRQLADRQDYDLEALAAQVGGREQFDLVCVSSGPTANNQPRNLGAFRCPKVLLVNDTHHGTGNPIRFVLDYLAREPYDTVVSLYNRDHNKWFRDIGGVRVGWIPGLSIEHYATPFIRERSPVISFVGGWRLNHPRRKNFITKIRNDGLPFDHQKLTREGCTWLYARSRVAFNCSLNGDLNMRIHEILSSGGTLLTDRLAPESGIDALLKEGRDYLAYDSYRDFRDKARWLLANPAEALAIAERGFTAYHATMRPEQLAPGFLKWVIEDDFPAFDYHDSLAPGGDLALRLSIYEFAQRKQLWREQTRALFCGPKANAIASDLAGLVRVSTVCVDATDGPQTAGDWPLVAADRELPGIDTISTDQLFRV